jgi:hypothetical protein
MRRATDADRPPAPATAADVLAFAGMGGLAMATGLLEIVIGLPVVPVGLLMNLFKPKSKPPAAVSA